MAYILKRPMFRKGGLSQETGIMSGLDRRGYAQGSYAPRVGYQDGSLWNKLKGLYSSIGRGAGIRGAGFTMSPPYTGTTLPATIPKTPRFSERGLLELGKRYGLKGLNLAKQGVTRFPMIAAALAGEHGTRPTDWEKEMDISRLDKILRDLTPGLGMKKRIEQYQDWKKGIRPDEAIEKVAGPMDYLQPEKKKEELIDTVEDDRETDLRTVYKDLLPLFKEELAADPESTAKEKYIALAQFGSRLLGQPGGDLVGAVGRAAEKPLEDVGKIISEKSKTDREAKLLALQAAMKETELGPIGKSVKDLIKLGYGKEAATKKVVEQGTGSATREATQAGIVKELQLTMQEDFGIKKGTASRSAAQKMLESEKAGVLAYEYTKLPKDKEERVEGNYYVSKEGRIGRYHKGKLIPPGESGFTGEMV